MERSRFSSRVRLESNPAGERLGVIIPCVRVSDRCHVFTVPVGCFIHTFRTRSIKPNATSPRVYGA